MQMLAYQREKVRNGGQRGGIYQFSPSRQPELGIVGTRSIFASNAPRPNLLAIAIASSTFV